VREDDQLKKAVSVTEMAKMVGLSRARFYQLMTTGVFPKPLRDPTKNRPFFDEELQRICLEVRRRNCGINGQPVLFYTQRQSVVPVSPKVGRGSQPRKREQHADLIDGLKGLGLTTVTAAQVGAALRELYPNGAKGVSEAQVIRAVFLHLKRQDRSNSVER
jgi:hypothetical protein